MDCSFQQHNSCKSSQEEEFLIFPLEKICIHSFSLLFLKVTLQHICSRLSEPNAVFFVTNTIQILLLYGCLAAASRLFAENLALNVIVIFITTSNSYSGLQLA